MNSRRETARSERDKAIDSLADDGNNSLERALDAAENRHRKGNFFRNVEHHEQSQVICLEELCNGLSEETEETETEEETKEETKNNPRHV